MFGIDSSELLVIAVVALVVIGPKDLPRVMRTVGHWVGRARGMAGHFRTGVDTMIRESELEDMEKKWKADNERIMREHPAPAPGEESAEPVADDGAPAQARGEKRSAEGAARARTRAAERGGAADPGPACAARGGRGRMSDPERTEGDELDKSKAPLLDHLIELRRRLLWSFAALAVTFGICLYFARPIFGFLVQPLIAAGQHRRHLHRRVRSLLRRDQGRLLRGPDDLLPDHRQPALAVRRARPLRARRSGPSCPSC